MSFAFSNTSFMVARSCDLILPDSNVTTKNIWYLPFCFRAFVIAFAAFPLNLISANPGVSM